VPIVFRGRSLPLRLPTWGLLLRRGGAEPARYLLPGEPDFARAAAPPWRYLEQMGAAHRLEADGAWLTVITRKRSRLFTEVKLVVEPVLPPDPNREPRMGRV
jgi:hypothetical protein